ncbi:hypothetical protein AAFF_G00044180 [Aldrovandia affinis]|uniref:Uncharacterized protein n=1 Tax=Aldrovandia affinis TaxID=143900 RepID=A0AAD7S248_9TELE|nr:hypothetical protein AAFF_G00044180 [Aldrovandia affinis]
MRRLALGDSSAQGPRRSRLSDSSSPFCFSPQSGHRIACASCRSALAWSPFDSEPRRRAPPHGDPPLHPHDDAHSLKAQATLGRPAPSHRRQTRLTKPRSVRTTPESVSSPDEAGSVPPPATGPPPPAAGGAH